MRWWIRQEEDDQTKPRALGGQVYGIEGQAVLGVGVQQEVQPGHLGEPGCTLPKEGALRDFLELVGYPVWVVETRPLPHF